MRDTDRVRYESCKRTAQFGVDYNGSLPAASKIVVKFAELGDAVNNIESAMGAQATAGDQTSQEFQEKGGSREDLTDLMTKVANAARAAEPENLGYQTRFRFNRALNDADLAAAANSFLSATTAERAILIEYGAPATWYADLGAMVTAFSAAFNDAASAEGSRASATAQITDLVNEAMQIKRTLGFLVQNYLGDDPGAMAAFHTASHVEVLYPTKPATPPTP